MEEALLEISNLDFLFELERGEAHALRGLDLVIYPGVVHSLVGESGSGKSVAAKAILGLNPMPPGRLLAGSVKLRGMELLGLPERRMRLIRGKEIGIVFQEPAKALNPAFRISSQIGEMLELHMDISRKAAGEKAQELLELVGLGHERRVLKSYPHELSGGMKQRAMIAMAISCNPLLLIADEPTTALDVTVQRQILDLILKLNRTLKTAVLFISHDLGVVHEISDVVSVIYAGGIVETAEKKRLFEEPLHPYTRLLIASIPDPQKRGRKLRVIAGRGPDAEAVPDGCAFHPRCPYAEDICASEPPEFREFSDRHGAACHMIGEKAMVLV